MPSILRLHAFAVVGVLALVACEQTPPVVLGPSAPSNVLATPGPGYVRLTWEHNGSDAEGFEIYRDGPDVGTATRAALTAIATVGPDDRSFDDHDVVIGAAATYGVRTLVAGAGTSTTMQSNAPVAIGSGVDFAVGTFNNALVSGPRTSFGVYIFLASEDVPPNGQVQIELSGGPSWNGGATMTFPIRLASFPTGFIWLHTAAPVVDGLYTMKVITDSATFTATASIDDATQLLPLAQEIVVSWSANDLTATWQPVAGARSYLVTVYVVTGGAPYARMTTSNLVTFKDAVLAPGNYVVGVHAINVDRTLSHRPPKPAQIDGSYASSSPFTVGGE